MAKNVLGSLNKYCGLFEKDYTEEAAICSLFKSGVTPESMLTAARFIQQKEKSFFLKLPVENRPDLRDENVATGIRQIAGIVLENKSFQIAADCIALTRNDPIMLKIYGPFSSFMATAGTNVTYRWMQKKAQDVKVELSAITAGLSKYICNVAEQGATIISVADPCGMDDILGERKYREFVADYFMLLVKNVLSNTACVVLHICPRTSLLLQKYGYLSATPVHCGGVDYAHALFGLSARANSMLVGHRCINLEQSGGETVYLLSIV